MTHLSVKSAMDATANIDVRAYDGEPAQLLDFVLPVWRNTYAGKLPVPLWTEEYFRWWLPWNRREFLVTAWENSALVGCLLARPFTFQYRDSQRPGTQCSWLTVDPQARRKGIAARMVEGMHRVYVEQGIEFEIGYVYTGTRFSMGPRFWKTRRQVKTISRTGFWVRVLDHAAVAQWDFNWLDCFGTKMLSWFQRAPRPRGDDNVRPFQDNDLPACQHLVNELAQRSDIGIIWNADELRSQLDYGDLARTMVLERGGEVRGLVNYYRLEFAARGSISVGLIDLFAFQQLSSREAAALLGHALVQMQREGIQLVMMYSPAQAPSRILFQNGFVPRLKDSKLAIHQLSDELPIFSTSNLQLLWR